MTCPILARYRKERNVCARFKKYIDLIDTTKEIDMARLFNASDHRNQRRNRRLRKARMGEAVYFLIGSVLAAHQQWNKMTFLQLDHEARVQGLLGPFQKHSFTAWQLRLKLKCEAWRIENGKWSASAGMVFFS
jgi:hypothetical protein